MDTLVLCFHRVGNPEHGGRSRLAISPDEFAAALDSVGQTREFVPLERLSQSSSSPRAVVTFDDGYADNLEVALPILESRGIPATFFISTGFIDTDFLYPPDAIDGLIDAPRDEITVELTNFISDGYWHALESLVTLPAEEYWRVLASARDAVRESVLAQDSSRRPMTLSEVRELASSPLSSLGPHTVTHRRLTDLSHREAIREIEGSVRFLAENSLATVPYFAYPFGQIGDISPGLAVEVRKRGFEPMTTLPVMISGLSGGFVARHGVPRLSVGPGEIAQWGSILALLKLFRPFPRLWLALLAVRRKFQALTAGFERFGEGRA